jgi:hypothetical protein
MRPNQTATNPFATYQARCTKVLSKQAVKSKAIYLNLSSQKSRPGTSLEQSFKTNQGAKSLKLSASKQASKRASKQASKLSQTVFN